MGSERICERCKGTGYLTRRGAFVVQLHECDRWGDYLDFDTEAEAVAKAVECGWGPRARVRRGKTVVYEGKPEHDHYRGKDVADAR